MSAYRIPEPQPLLSHRFERVLPGVFTRVRISEKRVRVDAPDVVALITIGMVLQLLIPVVAHWSWLWAFALSACVLFTLRIHLRVTKGRVWLVRTVLGVPWCVLRPRGVTLDDWPWFDDLDLAVVLSGEGLAMETLPVVGATMNGLHGAEVIEIRSACSRLLG